MSTKNVQNVFSKILKGVYIIGTRYNDKLNGMTAAWVCRVSFEPTLVMVAIGNKRYTHQMIEKSAAFSISVLNENQIDVAKHFGFKSGRDVDKFKDIPYETHLTGAPVLKDCLAWLDCKIVSSHQAGDHTLFIGKVLSGAIKKETKPLTYFNQRLLWDKG